MAMNIGSRRGGPLASINVTPMIDVLLVLLIIFMVVYPQLQKGHSLQVPPPDRESDPRQPPESLALEVLPGGVYRLNQQPIAQGTLRRELAAVLAGRNRRVLFVKADERVAYREVVGAVDESRAAGATVVGLVPRAPH